MRFWKFAAMRCLPLILLATVAPAASLLDTLAAPPTNRLDAQLGFSYYQRMRGNVLTDSGRLYGPEAFAFTRQGGFFASARLKIAIDLSSIETLIPTLPEFALGWGTATWLVRAGLLHSRVGTPWADEWQASWRHGFLEPTKSQETLSHYPVTLASVEGRFRPSPLWELGAGLSYRDFGLADDPLLPQLALEARFTPGPFLARVGLSTHQFGRRATSDNPFTDRRVYTFLADFGWRWLKLLNEMEFYLWSPAEGRWEDSHVLRLEPPLARGFRLYAEMGILARNTWDPVLITGVLDVHFGWRTGHFEAFVEEHLGVSLWNGLPMDHRLNIGILLNIENN